MNTPAAAPTGKPRYATAGTRKSSKLPPRSRAREFALQALYQHIVSRNDATSIDAFTRGLQGFNKADAAHYDALLHGCIAMASELDALITPLLDRPLAQISPIERACMWLGAYELLKCPEIPWRVVLNESIELAKDFGGTDGYKYVNGILNRLAPTLRPHEVQATRAATDKKIKKESTPPAQDDGNDAISTTNPT